MGLIDRLGFGRRTTAQPTHFIINDVSEKEEHADAIMGIANTLYGSNYRMVTASELRRRVIEFLRKQGKRYDLVLFGDCGGTRVFGHIDFKALGIADNADRIRYSSHRPTEISVWQEEGPFKKRLRPIIMGGKKRIF